MKLTVLSGMERCIDSMFSQFSAFFLTSSVCSLLPAILTTPADAIFHQLEYLTNYRKLNWLIRVGLCESSILWLEYSVEFLIEPAGPKHIRQHESNVTLVVLQRLRHYVVNHTVHTSLAVSTCT